MTDYKLVPVEPTPEMVEAAEDAYMPFGDMELAIRMALLAAPDHIADAGKMVSRQQIREVFLRNGFTIKPGCDDLREYVYKAAFELLELAAPAVQGEPVGEVRFELGAPSSIFAELYSETLPSLAPGTKLYTAPQPAEQQAPADYSLTPVPDELFAAEFSAWWEQHGQFCRAGGGDYERTFAFEAWRYLYPRLVKLQTAAAEQKPAPDVEGLVAKMAILIAAGNRLNASAEECNYDDGTAEVAGSEYWCEFRDALDAARAALAAHRRQGGK